MVYVTQDTNLAFPIEYGSGGGVPNTPNMYNVGVPPGHSFGVPYGEIRRKPNNIPDPDIERFEMVKDTPIRNEDVTRISPYILVLVSVVLFFALELWAHAGISLIQTKYYKGSRMEYVEYGIWAVLATLVFVVIAKLTKIPIVDL